MGSSQNLPINGQDAVSSPDPTRKKRKNRRGRGSTFLPDIIKDRSSGIRKVVKYNRRGQPIGSEKFSSYLGVLARTMVPIHRTWKKVSNEDKEMLWKCVQTTFNVDPRSRKNVLSAIAADCRTFRKTLTRHIHANKSDPDIISRPPAIYCYIEAEHWDAFVKHRLSKDFEKHSDAQRGRQKKNICRHRLGRKSYANLEQEQIQLMKKSVEGAKDEFAEGEGVDTQPFEVIDRSVLWQLSRQNKNGEYDSEAIKEQAALIVKIFQSIDWWFVNLPHQFFFKDG